ncbi:MAG: hypothetical protein GC156_01250 [Actinomycetales bacterium]|nr:hypothetical protein [Actinomycetales bacterium]
MSKFVFLFGGQSEPTDDVMAAWHEWFDSIGSHIVDSGNPFGPGREVNGGSGTDLTPAMSPATGYSIVNADSLDEAVKLLDGCPSTVTRVYEAMPM